MGDERAQSSWIVPGQRKALVPSPAEAWTWRRAFPVLADGYGDWPEGGVGYSRNSTEVVAAVITRIRSVLLSGSAGKTKNVGRSAE